MILSDENLITLIGFTNSNSGLGQDIRTLSQVLLQHNIKHTLVPLPDKSSAASSKINYEAFRSATENSKVNIFCISPVQVAYALKQLPSFLIADAYNIGYLPWELPRLEKLPEFDVFNEFWGISKFVTNALSELGRPSFYMPSAVIDNVVTLPPWPRYMLDRKPFRFLSIFDAASFLERKNPKAVIASFLRAFPINSQLSVELVFKVSRLNTSDPYWQLMRKELALDSRIKLITQNLSEEMMNDLYQSADAYVSLHRSEGFGRTVAEAMLHRLPVIATDWSGSTDIVNSHTAYPIPYQMVSVAEGEYPLSSGQYWAEPDLAAAATAMHALVKMPLKDRRSLAHNARSHILESRGEALVGRQLAERLHATVGLER